MTVPGQYLNTQAADRQHSALADVRLELDERRTPERSPELPDGVGDEGYAALVFALVRAFCAESDQILWEGPSRDDRLHSQMPEVEHAGQLRFGVGPRRASITLPSHFRVVRPGAGLSLALGMSAARRNLGQEHWIVVVAAADSLTHGLSHDLIEQLHAVQSRLLIVAIDGELPSHAEARWHDDGLAKRFEGLDSRWLPELGLPCRGPVSADDAAALTVELHDIRGAAMSAILKVCVASPESTRSERPTESQGRGMLRLEQGTEKNGRRKAVGGLALVVDELQALATADARVVAIVQEELQQRIPLGVRRPDSRDSLSLGGRSPFAQAQGLSLGGCRPFLVVTSQFLQQSLDQVRYELCDARQVFTLIVVPDEDRPDTGNDEPVRQSSDVAYLRLLPHTVVAVPRDGLELRRLLRWSTNQAVPVAIRLPRDAGFARSKSFGADDRPLEQCRADVLQEGYDVALLAVGAQVSLAMRAAEELSAQGVSTGVVDARFVDPLDGELLHRLARQTSGLVVLEDEAAHGGFATAVLERLAAEGIATPVLVSGHSAIVAHAAQSMSADDVVREVVRQAVDLVNHSTGATLLYATSPANRNGSRKGSARLELQRPDFSPELLEREKSLVLARHLSPEVEEWFAVYSQVGERQRFLWQWCEQGAELTTMPAVSRELFDHVCHTKVLSIMLCVLLDDVADQQGREKFLEILLKIVDGQPAVEAADLGQEERFYAEVTHQLAEIYQARVREYPCYAQYADLLRYDQLQYFNTMRYSQLLNRNLWLLNPIEHDLYLPHAMDMMSFATIDLMCMPDFSIRELGRLREALWFLQCMGRVGNLLCTWRREIHQHDFTSGVFARAVAQGDLTVEQLRQPDPRQIESAILKGGHERYFLRRWQYYRECFLAAAQSVESVDMLQLLEGNERFFRMHLGSRGLI